MRILTAIGSCIYIGLVFLVAIPFVIVGWFYATAAGGFEGGMKAYQSLHEKAEKWLNS